jgi:hypothetical protein
MQEHIKYWKELVDRRIALVFVAVVDPRGVFGIAIIETKDESAANNIGPHKVPLIRYSIHVYIYRLKYYTLKYSSMSSGKSSIHL